MRNHAISFTATTAVYVVLIVLHLGETVPLICLVGLATQNLVLHLLFSFVEGLTSRRSRLHSRVRWLERQRDVRRAEYFGAVAALKRWGAWYASAEPIDDPRFGAAVKGTPQWAFPTPKVEE